MSLRRKIGTQSLSKNQLLLSVIPAVLKPESSMFKRFWIPASAGMTKNLSF